MANDGIIGATWTLSNASLDSTYVGLSFVLAGSAHNDGTWTIATVISPTTFTTVATPTPETFNTGVTATFQPPGTAFALPNSLNDYALYIELHAAIAILDKQNLDSTALQARLAQQVARIQPAARQRRDQPSQAPMVRRRGFRNGGWPV